VLCRQGGEWSKHTETNGLPFVFVTELASGKAGFLHPRAFGVNEGMPAEECSSGFCPAGLKTKSGMIRFSIAKGFVLLDSHRQEDYAPMPNVLLEEVLVNGEILTPDAGVAGKPNGRGASEPGDSSRVRAITIPPGGREHELHYTGIRFGSPDKRHVHSRTEATLKYLGR
jgi:hypothetical protein